MLSLTHLTGRGVLYGLARHKVIAVCYGFEAIANLCITLLLVKKYGIIGVAIGTAVPHLVMVVLILPVVISKIVHLIVLLLTA